MSFLKGDKDSSVVIMDKSDYVIKYQRVMIEESINNGVYANKWHQSQRSKIALKKFFWSEL